ncbi:HdeD family acid-resistance protein [Tropicimonas sp. IMCC6043]|uniref:HdeD family acid-resistance protein n=1 Tax=Tropicimonas sp. IMCC6043 TaxID=2510645 RepID=UPI0013E9A818|nr:DUF308 domain-containing protein [Tropicimonas sp. IMCC6043]
MSEWARWLIAGLVSIALGTLALGNAAAVSIGIVWVTGALLVLAGAVQTYVGFSDSGRFNKFLSVMLGSLMLALGLSFMRNPEEGTMAITAAIAGVIAGAGLYRLGSAYRKREAGYFFVTLVTGALATLLAGVILANFLHASSRLLGILLGVELLFNGVALSILALFLRANSDEL